MKHVFEYFTNVKFNNRYVDPAFLASYLVERYPDNVVEVGNSLEGRPIYKFSIGTGKTKVLAWSQMHGNESTATLAMLDLLESLRNDTVREERLWRAVSLDFIFMLNPDGSARWTRRNAAGIDINRDFLMAATPEMQILKRIVADGNYDYALNLHDQRTIFTTDGHSPATLSFLAPSQDAERTLTPRRKQSMAVIANAWLQLKDALPKRIGRYTDEFYPTATGDNLMLRGLTNILVEGGHSPDDYHRVQTRRYYTMALYHLLVSMGLLHGRDYGYENYFDIPENRSKHVDLIYRNVKLNTDFPCVVDVAVQYREELEEGADEISFVPIVTEVGDLGAKKGWKEVDCTGLRFVSEKTYPKIDAPVNFRIE
ncbi:MAG: peptidase M14 [Chryseobacterium sp.]|nr:MAG: peptidase M14 [Chryseobacterium sp.]